MPLWLHDKLHVPRQIAAGLEGQYKKRPAFTEHHEAHAASAFFPSPLRARAILTLDGVGEWATATPGLGEGNRIHLTHELALPPFARPALFGLHLLLRLPGQLGGIQTDGSGSLRRARYEDLILQKLLDLKADGSFRMDMSYFHYCQGLTMTSRKFERLFGGPPRRAEAPLTEREMDLAASIQKVTEEIMLRAARHLHQQTAMTNLCLAGGVALNCVGNGRILREGPFEKIWIQPAAGDAGGALGVALFLWHQLLGQPRTPCPLDSQHGSLLGPEFSEQQIREFLDRQGAAYRIFEEEAALCDGVAELIARAMWWAGCRAAWSSVPAPWATAASSATPAMARCSR